MSEGPGSRRMIVDRPPYSRSTYVWISQSASINDKYTVVPFTPDLHFSTSDNSSAASNISGFKKKNIYILDLLSNGAIVVR